MTDHRIATVTLAFRDQEQFQHVSDPVAEDLSSAARADDTLFLVCDETSGLDRLRPDGDGRWGAHEHINLAEFFELPAGPDGEMDIEGLAVADDGDGPWLWVAGSHSLKRGKPKRHKKKSAKALKRMRDLERDPNRFFFCRLPLGPDEDGGLTPMAEHHGRRAAAVKARKKSSKLLGWLDGDPHLDPFLDAPCKENGFDIEGIAARGMRVWLGLRGPVLLGHAVIVELELKTDGDGFLKAKRLDGKRRYVKHLLPSDGLGVRDLALDGDDMLVLLGPTMSGDGPSRVLRWRDALGARPGVAAEAEVGMQLALPYLGARDHPEGITRWPEAGDDAWLVVCDAPAPERLDEAGLTVEADIVRLPRS